MSKRLFSFLMAAALVMCAALPCVAQAAKVKVAFAMLGTVDDRGWNTAHSKGVEALKEALGDKIELSITENVGPQDAERVIRDYAQKGYDIIFGNAFPYMDAMERVAAEFPNVKFEHCSGYKMAKNMSNYFVRLYQAEYLAGYTAGLMGFKNVGTVATHPIPEPIRGINAFTIGLKKGLTEAGVSFDPKKVNTVVWMKSWADPIKETALAETLAGRGHDLIRQMADTPESSLAACAQGVPAVGYGTDAASFGADCAITSTTPNWGPYYVATVQSVIDGTWKSQAYWGGFDKDGVRLAPFAKDVPADVQAKVMAELDKLKKGEDHIFAGPVADQSGKEVIAKGAQANDGDLLGMMYLVEGVSGSIPQ